MLRNLNIYKTKYILENITSLINVVKLEHLQDKS